MEGRAQMVKAGSIPIEKLVVDLAERARAIRTDLTQVSGKADAPRRPVTSELKRRAQARAHAAAQSVIL